MARNRGGQGRGGRRVPRNPAPVSGVGADSARTDGGAGQPIRVPKDQPYGERQASEAAQAAAPLASAEPVSGGPPPGGGGGSDIPASPFGIDAFGPTQRPNEPITAGAMGAGAAPDADMLLRVILQKRFTPYLARLLRG